MKSVDLDRINQFVLHKQHLTPSSKSNDLVRIVRDVSGLHATGKTTPYLSIFARSSEFKRDCLDVELYEKNTLAKIRGVRKTIYIYTKEMLPFVWKATADKVISVSKRFMENRGVTEEDYNGISQRVLGLLQGREMTAVEIKTALALEADLPSILYLMCDQGLLVRGRSEKGWKDKNHYYARFRDVFPDVDLDSITEEEAIAALVKSYISAFGPVTETDIYWWIGLGKTKIRASLNDLGEQIERVSIPGQNQPCIILHSDKGQLEGYELPTEPVINFLPYLDLYIMGYKERNRYLLEEFRDLVFDRSGNATSVMMSDGRIVGVWDYADQPQPCVKIFAFRPLGRDIKDEIFNQAGEVGKFIAGEAVLILECDRMAPLPSKPAGSVMSPLKEC